MNFNDSSRFLAVTLTDLLDISRRHFKGILLGGLLFALLLSYHTLSRPPLYQAQATFREKQKSAGGSAPSFSELLGLGAGGAPESEAVSVMTSKKLIGQLADEFCLQGILRPHPSSLGVFKTIRDNLTLQYAHLTRRKTPLFPDPIQNLSLIHLNYRGEEILSYKLVFDTHHSFSVRDKKNKEIATGELNNPVNLKNVAFTVGDSPTSSVSGKTFSLAILPKALVVRGLISSLSIKPDEDDRLLLKLAFRHPSRLFVPKFLNRLMEAYQEHLVAQSDHHASFQLAYLSRRKNESIRELETVMQEYAQRISNDATALGMTDTEKEMEFLAQVQKELRNREREVSLEIDRLNQVIQDPDTTYDRFIYLDPSGTYGGLVVNLTSLKQQRDALELALLKRTSTTSYEEAFQRLSLQKENLRKDIALAELLYQAVKEKRPCPVSPPTRETWLTPLLCLAIDQINKREVAQLHPTPPMESQEEALKEYLRHLIQISTVQLQTLEERLTKDDFQSKEFEGITLETARQAYLTLQEHLNEVQAAKKQYLFVADQLRENPSSPVATIAADSSDPLIRELISRSFENNLALSDKSNRSEKEQERIRLKETIQREFVANHASQSAELLNLREQLLQDKMAALQSTTLDLVNQEISLQQQQLDLFLHSRKQHFEQEKALIKQAITKAEHEIAQVPDKWVSEQLIHQQIDQCQRVMEEVTRLVESKNIAHNLEVCQSAPLDAAGIPILPRSPMLPLFFTTGLLCGLIIAVTFTLWPSLTRGVQATLSNVPRVLSKTAGPLFPQRAPDDNPDNLPTLRRMARVMIEGKLSFSGVLYTLILGDGPNYSQHLAQILGKQGQKVLIMPLNFDRPPMPDEIPGLLQLLQGKALHPKIQHRSGYDLMVAGGDSAYGPELLQSPRFQQVVEMLKEKYDWILGVSTSAITSAEAESLSQTADGVSITISKERLPDLAFFHQWEQTHPKKVVIALVLQG